MEFPVFQRLVLNQLGASEIRQVQLLETLDLRSSSSPSGGLVKIDATSKLKSSPSTSWALKEDRSVAKRLDRFCKSTQEVSIS